MTDEPDPGRRTVAGPYPDTGEPDMTWVRLDDSLFTDDEGFASLPCDLQVAYLAVATLGSRLTPPGRWRDLTHVRASLPGPLADAVPRLIEAGVMDDGPGGIGVLRRDFYPSETSGADRTRRYRERHGDSHGDSIVSSRESKSPESPLPRRGATPATPAPALRAPARGGGDDWYAAALVIEDVTQRPYALVNPDSKMGEMVMSMVVKHGLDRVSDALRRAGTAAGSMPTVAQVVFGAGNMLDAIPRVRPDCDVCYNMGVTARGRRPCPDCGRSEPDPRAN